MEIVVIHVELKMLMIIGIAIDVEVDSKWNLFLLICSR